MASSGSSCSCDEAGPFLEIPDEKLFEKMLAVWDEFPRDFPNYDVMACWEVTLLSREYFTHYSLLLTAPGFQDEGFVIQLIVTAEDNRYSLDFRREALSNIKEKSFERTVLGTTEPTGLGTFIWEAYDLLMNLGSYTSALNKCQHYCQKVAELLGVHAVTFKGATVV